MARKAIPKGRLLIGSRQHGSEVSTQRVRVVGVRVLAQRRAARLACERRQSQVGEWGLLEGQVQDRAVESGLDLVRD